MNFFYNLPLIILYLLIFVFPICFSSGSLQWYNSCGTNFTCGSVSVGFPFWGGIWRPKQCGYPEFELSCEGEIKSTIQIAETKFYVLDIDETGKSLKIARQDLSDGYCLTKFQNTTMNFDRFYYPVALQNITLLYGCPPPPGDSYGGETVKYPGQFYCRINGVSDTTGYCQSGATGPNGCHASVVVPVPTSLEPDILNGTSDLSTTFDKGFMVNYKVSDEDAGLCSSCNVSKGRCGFDSSENVATCFCPDGTYGDAPCGNKSQVSGNKSLKKAVIIGVSAGSGILVALLAACLFMVQRKKRIISQTRTKDLHLASLSTDRPSSNGFYPGQGYSTTPSTFMSQSTPSYPSSKSDLGNSSSYLGVKLFSYGELEEATENFNESRELGDGGFGTVYYGELSDGRVVAVKRLYENSVKRMGQFMNEVQILARLRHDNLVTLYGCTSKRSRDLLLVYEYIPNGTVADHLHGRLSVSNKIPWSIRLSIAVETAEALSFLHENDVIHRDVKTTNILLDNNFRVKVADFGLSRLFPNDVTHVSTAPQGTPGYVDPEYYQCYHLTEKSDVYSFGVVIMELISSKVAVDITRRRHDINLSNMAVDRIQKHALQEIVDPSLGYDNDYVVQKLVNLTAELAFRCLQPERETRPLMKEVLETLKDIQKTMVDAQKQVVVDIQESDDDAGLLKNDPPPFSPDKEVNDRKQFK
ncbi:LEAF RUST 10 DISEASE-RESISTANCE LOCUS RECEPTOR-LIKE PROTEIN KINASE-like 1.4 [Silene latifolia]|uniref:LEAF RUST 10 DISEASE-RESISTANCE LOCUS RECEPTOR-LIKE PROTEIN KINASE-like 1.4 n=1 Tax=Silene latifolia TaxID=37657 RepID=UPI003D773AE4